MSRINYCLLAWQAFVTRLFVSRLFVVSVLEDCRLFDAADEGASAMRAFNEIMAKETALQSIIVPIGDGLWVGLKL